MDEARAGIEGMRRLIAFFELEGLMGVYARHLSRDEARKHIAYAEKFGAADLAWFDLRWPEP